MTEYKSKEEIDELINAHWEYVKELLTFGQPIPLKLQDLDIIEFHYKSAFRHGYKHGVEDAGK